MLCLRKTRRHLLNRHRLELSGADTTTTNAPHVSKRQRKRRKQNARAKACFFNETISVE